MLSASGGLAGLYSDEPDLLSSFVLSILSILEYCTKFVTWILTKIIKIISTRCQILWLKYTKFDSGWGSAQSLLVGCGLSVPCPTLPRLGPLDIKYSLCDVVSVVL